MREKKEILEEISLLKQNLKECWNEYSIARLEGKIEALEWVLDKEVA